MFHNRGVPGERYKKEVKVMLLDVAIILSLVIFLVVGLIMHFNKPARRFYSLITAAGVLAIVLRFVLPIIEAKDWYQNIVNVVGHADVLHITSYLVCLILGTLVLALVINPIYKLVDYEIGQIGKGTAVLTGGVVGLFNGAIAVMVLLQVLGLFSINPHMSWLNSIQSFVSVK